MNTLFTELIGAAEQSRRLEEYTDRSGAGVPSTFRVRRRRQRRAARAAWGGDGLT